MSTHFVPTGAAYRLVLPLTRVASRLLPEQVHPGRRAYRVVAQLGLAPGRAHFSASVLESYLRSLLLQRHLTALNEHALHRFCEHQVVYEGALPPQRLLEECRPLIFATPHYGAPLAALLAGAHLLRNRRTLHVFYDRARHGTRLNTFFDRAGIEAQGQLDGHAGVRAALRALGRNECIAILPDAFDDITHTLVVPFFDRLLRVASGTAHLALRSGALIIPTFAIPQPQLGLRIVLGEPIDPVRLTAADEAQATFTLSHLLFGRIEDQLRFEPEHWRCWETLPHVSTALEAHGPLNDSLLLRVLESRLHALPMALEPMPALERLLR